MRLLIVLVLIVSTIDYASAQQSATQLASRVALRPTMGAAVPLDVVLVDEEGRATTLRACAHGKPTLLVFAWYECPMLCNELLNGLTRAVMEVPQDAGADFEVVVVSIAPDAPAARAAATKATALRRYGRAGTEGGWHFLSGGAASIRRLTAACGFQYTYDGVKRQYAHPAGLLVLTPDGRISRCLLGISFLPNDVRLSLVEASNGAIGTLVEKLQLLCWQYDPASGRWGLWIFGIVRAASLITMLGLGCGIWRSVRRERHATAH